MGATFWGCKGRFDYSFERIVTCALVSCKWSSYLVPVSRKRIEGQLVINHIVDFCVTLDGDVPQVSLIIKDINLFIIPTTHSKTEYNLQVTV